MTNIKTLNISKFRGIENQDIIIGKQLTAIMGQNGAQKSTILGMLAQPFNFSGYKDITDDPFQTKFGEIFNFSEKHDAIGDHRYSLELYNSSALIEKLPNKGNKFNVNSRKRTGKLCLFVYDVEEKEFKSQGKDTFKGFINTYKKMKTEIFEQEINERKLAKSHKENEINLIELLNHYKEERVENIYESAEKNSDSSKLNLIVELKAESSHLRFVAGDSNQSGDGNLSLPVIYLGLSRVVPLGEVDRDHITQFNTERIKKYEDEIANKSKDILLDYDSPDYHATPLDISDSSYTGTRVGIHTEKYSPITMSAGQDNIGKILSAIYSFKDLKDELGEEYIGGLLLIDELDATLYPGAQKELIKFMKKVSNELDIQIVFTTHSIHIVDEMYSETQQEKYSINYLIRHGDNLLNDHNMTPETIYYKIAVESKSISKIPCICEDEYGANMLKSLLSEADEFNVDEFEFVNAEASFTTLKKLMSINNKHMQHNIYVIDGDHSEIIDAFNKDNINHTGVALPIAAPEVVLSRFLTEEIPYNHPIFIGNEYNRQQLIKEYREHQTSNVIEKSKSFIKRQEKTGKRIFQNNCKGLFGIWANWFKEEKPDEFSLFINNFKSAYNIVIANIDKKL